MNICEHFKKYESICLSFKESEKNEVINELHKNGFPVKENICSPVILHRDKTISFVHGMAMGILFSLPEEEFKKYRPNILKTKYGELKKRDSILSHWNKIRKRI